MSMNTAAEARTLQEIGKLTKAIIEINTGDSSGDGRYMLAALAAAASALIHANPNSDKMKLLFLATLKDCLNGGAPSMIIN